MKRTMHLLLTCALALMLLAVGGCDRYRMTLNERVISDPEAVLTNIELADEGLKSCLEQTARDKQVRTTGQLRTLVCTHAGIEDLEGIQVFSKLHTLNLADNSLTSISPLLFLGNLESVNLEGNGQLDCDELESLREHLPRGATLIGPEHC